MRKTVLEKIKNKPLIALFIVLTILFVIIFIPYFSIFGVFCPFPEKCRFSSATLI